jgi:type II secretory pathway pseudopilin PulG
VNARRIRAAGKRGQRGYALLVIIFLVALLLISTTVIAPNILTEGRREKEKEMIWRGKQYTRGVKLYYRKLGRFPTSLDDLTKPKVGSLRFMRQAYKDPMNKEDGSWRFIYVGPAGQLIGSLKPPQQNLQIPGATGIGTPASALNGPNATTQPGAGGLLGLGGALQGGAMPGTTGTNPAGTNGPGATGTATTGAPVSADQGTPGANPADAIPTGDTPTIVGGNIIGVGSKINKSSIMVYEKAKNYRLFEFIWDPSKDGFGAGQPGMQTGTGLGQQIGQPLGQQPGQNPTGPQQNAPQTPPQNPPQQ